MAEPQALCRVCGQPAGWTFEGKFGEPVLALCAKHGAADYPKTQCAGCQMIVQIDGKVLRGSTKPYPYSQLVFCAHCNGADLKCGACFTPVGFDGTGRFPNTRSFTADGDSVGYRCAFCSTGGLNAIESTVDLTRGAVGWLTDWLRARGDGLPDVSGRIKYQLSDARTLRGGDSGQTLGLCTKTEAKGQPNQYRVDVLVGMRPVCFVETLVHELTHVWWFEKGRDRKEYIEGFCNFTALSYLEQFGGAGSAERAEAQQRKAMMLEDRSPIYGSNLRAFNLVSKNAPNIVKWFIDSVDAKQN